MYFIRLLSNILIALIVATSATVSSAGALEAKSACCCANIIENIKVVIENDCLCCLPIPSHKLPNKAVQIQIKSVNTDLQTSTLRVLANQSQARIRTFIDKRRPLHLADNELYLKKRALLI